VLIGARIKLLYQRLTDFGKLARHARIN